MTHTTRRQFLAGSISVGAASLIADQTAPRGRASEISSIKAPPMQTASANSIPPMIFEDDFAMRQNVAWRVEKGKFDPANPLMLPAFPWDSACCFNGGTVLKDPIDG